METKLIIEGKAQLCGRVRLSGAKNSILPLLAATILCREPCRFTNVPDLSDVQLSLRILAALGAAGSFADGEAAVDACGAAGCEIPEPLMAGMRSSFMYLGPILARHGRAVVYAPGGCRLGARPVDIHLSALGAMGAKFDDSAGKLTATVPAGRLHGAVLRLRYPSVGATENILMAAATAAGTTTVIGAAREPEIYDLARFLNSCGARVRGAGESVITVEGVETLGGCTHSVIPDRILASTLISAAAATRSDILLDDLPLSLLGNAAEVYGEAGVRLEPHGNGLAVECSGGRPRAVPQVVCAPYPQFPTDAGPMFAALGCLAQGGGEIYDSVFENRFSFAEPFCSMGAEVRVLGRSLYYTGKKTIAGGAEVRAQDLRAGAALLCLALGSENGAVLSGVEHIDRGYDRIERIFSALGAKIRRTET